MKIINTDQLFEKYRKVISPDINVLVIDYETEKLMGYNYDEYIDGSVVYFLHPERDFNKIWGIDKNAIRLGSGAYDPYDTGIMGYVLDNKGNARIIYDIEQATAQAGEEYYPDMDEEYRQSQALSDWDFNVDGSMPNWELKHRPIPVSTVW